MPAILPGLSLVTPTLVGEQYAGCAEDGKQANQQNVHPSRQCIRDGRRWDCEDEHCTIVPCHTGGVFYRRRPLAQRCQRRKPLIL